MLSFFNSPRKEPRNKYKITGKSVIFDGSICDSFWLSADDVVVGNGYDPVIRFWYDNKEIASFRKDTIKSVKCLPNDYMVYGE